MHCALCGGIITFIADYWPVDGVHFRCDLGQQVEYELSSRSSKSVCSSDSISKEQNGTPQDCLRIQINTFYNVNLSI